MYLKNLTAIFILVSFGGAVVLGSSFASPLLIAAILMLGMYGIVLVGRPAELLFISFIATVLFKGTLDSLSIPFIGYLNNVFQAVFFALLVGWSLTGKYTKAVIPKEKKIFIPALACVFISAVMCGKGLSAFKWMPYYYLTYFTYIMFFLVGRQVLREEHIPKIIRFFAGFMIFQYLMNLGYMAGVNPIPQPFVRLQVDSATGTFSGSLQSAYYALLAGFLIFSLSDNRGIDSFLKKLFWGIFSILMLHNFYLTNANHAVLLFFGCVCMFFLFVSPRRAMKVWTIIAFVGFFPLYSVFQEVEFTSQEQGLGSWQKTLGIQTIEDRWNYSIKNGPKMQVYRKAFVDGLSNPRIYLFGEGPVQGISAKALRVENLVAMHYVGDIYLTTSGVGSLKGGSILESPISGLSELMVELGIVGVCCYYLPFLYLLLRISMFYRKGMYSRNQAIIAGALIPFLILTLVVSTLTTVFSVAYFYATIWLLASLVWDPSKPQSEISEDHAEGKAEPLSVV